MKNVSLSLSKTTAFTASPLQGTRGCSKHLQTFTVAKLRDLRRKKRNEECQSELVEDDGFHCESPARDSRRKKRRHCKYSPGGRNSNSRCYLIFPGEPRGLVRELKITVVYRLSIASLLRLLKGLALI